MAIIENVLTVIAGGALGATLTSLIGARGIRQELRDLKAMVGTVKAQLSGNVVFRSGEDGFIRWHKPRIVPERERFEAGEWLVWR